MSLAENLANIKRTLRQPDRPILLAVSKRVPASLVREAHALGMRHFGENYLQEALDKQDELHDLKDICWHFIGRIQRNKTQEIARHFAWVESVDRLLIAQRLNSARQEVSTPLNVLIEVAVSSEDSKGGCPPAQLVALAEGIQQLPFLRLRGLMALVHPDPDQANVNFQQMHSLFNTLLQSGNYPDLDTLSMGTSSDFVQALEHGATEIRLGTRLFGSRHQEAT
ncbi:YggS family pyridoxal phosphate-dependent enzyme [Acidithiobacillus thiooxidans]|uniref:Pyridoxal phosphate homeostasis protein n=1 Tax=Acidithiobacillus thiooxidans TaxID=930 RepID=A0A1C2IGU1_ACITH|nr:YggS family pyridoxal phosphate-dependent enzyme [Acidithiobacillus thiooxidans]MBU2838112.1 YggS family pyridoxal phosphate-dependent enzyme [Acidithiobacillus thiooxidans]OCX71752.1 YggS family pyridoxal phosphate enzyme [Acidithiobacillus thiooxidans]OCX75192.1 YggS family pyridoxal phosphate enzyme [Acidithiobacillus thiooxidans]OCX75272.1 YggS family pyridoxal phosphate enzyme [Acidithiobacillus thiooxidans]OCX82547.1 YggS family pyridoxal phosphate enzyme [Acidithiobacillus thiooxidan